MIVEIRTYKVKQGMRDRFLEFFERKAVPLQRSKGMRILGPLVDLENQDVFVWMRAFPSLEERERMTDALYESDEWKNGLRAIALPMLDSYSVALTVMPPGFVDDLHDVCQTASASDRESPARSVSTSPSQAVR